VENIPLAGKRFAITVDEDGDLQVTGLPAEFRLVTNQLRAASGADIPAQDHQPGRRP
jgi:hypothetical protein